jgi:hypothetical protein
MTTEQIQQLYPLLGSTGFALYIIWKLIEKFVLGNSLEQKVKRLETNHLAHVQADIERHEAEITKLFEEQNKQGRVLARIDERTSHLVGHFKK